LILSSCRACSWASPMPLGALAADCVGADGAGVRARSSSLACCCASPLDCVTAALCCALRLRGPSGESEATAGAVCKCSAAGTASHEWAKALIQGRHDMRVSSITVINEPSAWQCRDCLNASPLSPLIHHVQPCPFAFSRRKLMTRNTVVVARLASSIAIGRFHIHIIVISLENHHTGRSRGAH
jgi:hypothetical protein